MTCVCDSYQGTPASFEEMIERCDAAPLISTSLIEIGRDESSWYATYRCTNCSAIWVEERPFSELHGSGPPCLYQLNGQEPGDWLRAGRRITVSLRSRHEDDELLATFGPDVGPETCRSEGCANLKIGLSVYCSSHHFHQIKGRAPYAVDAA